jgi:mannose-6-phosphate isomerase-like protein (cupin superfamily)
MEQTPKAKSAIPADDLERQLHVVDADSADAPHVGVVGDTYTILVSGRDTAGRYSAIDMLVPPGGGPPPHRHDFEEMFTVLEGAVESRSAAKSSSRRKEILSTSRQTHPTSSGTRRRRRLVFSVFARQQVRKNSSWKSARS